MDKATEIISETVSVMGAAFAMELHRQRIESEHEAESLPSLAGRRAARARAHTLAQMASMTTARELAGNLGTAILALGIAARVMGLSPRDQADAIADWERSLA